jgi:uncharacterized OB-fold protein
MASPPRPAPDPMTRFFWEGANLGRLLVLQCCTCSKFIHPPRPVCRFCLSIGLAAQEVSGRASLYTWTVAERAFHPFFADKVHYVYATVELVEQPGLRLITNIVDCPHEDLRVGMPLQAVFREVAPDFTLPMFRPSF